MHKFTCAGCGETWLTNVSEEEQEQEFVEVYGHPSSESDEPVVSVCDDCYEKIIASKKTRND